MDEFWNGFEKEALSMSAGLSAAKNFGNSLRRSASAALKGPVHSPTNPPPMLQQSTTNIKRPTRLGKDRLGALPPISIKPNAPKVKARPVKGGAQAPAPAPVAAAAPAATPQAAAAPTNKGFISELAKTPKRSLALGVTGLYGANQLMNGQPTQ